MEEAFLINYDGVSYEVVPEEDHTFTVFKMDEEYMLITKLKGKKWIKIDYKTEEPIWEEDEEVDGLGSKIEAYLAR